MTKDLVLHNTLTISGHEDSDHEVQITLKTMNLELDRETETATWIDRKEVNQQ